MPRSSFHGRARAAIRVPTAASQSRKAIGAASIESGVRIFRSRWRTAPIRSKDPDRRATRRA